MIKPALTLAQERDLTLDSYVLHINTHHCRNCSSTEQFSTLYEVWVLPRQPGTRQLKPRMSVLPLKPNRSVQIVSPPIVRRAIKLRSLRPTPANGLKQSSGNTSQRCTSSE
jgi:hypothetical protein